jgi:FkbM family methyltransferase
MDAFLVNKRIDLVDFEDLKLFMLEEDNLYRAAVPEHRKRQNLETFQTVNLKNGTRPFAVTPENVGQVKSVRYGVFVVMHHLWANGLDFDVLDVGSHIGDFGLRAGSCIRTSGRSSQVVTFDPSEAGALVPYSIELNRLQDIVKHEMLAVSDMTGLVLFQYRPGHSEEGVIAAESPNASGLAATWIKRFNQLPFRQRIAAYFGLGISALKRVVSAGKINTRYSLIAHGVDIIEYVRQNGLDRDLFVKIDIEGYDPRVINRLTHLLPERKMFIIFEFTPSRFACQQEAAQYLETLSKDFHVFDLYYCPNPTRFTEISARNLATFTGEVAGRTQGYTDVFLLDKRAPACDALLKRLGGLSPEPDAQLL